MNFLEPGPPVRTKVCGITAQEDASMAIDAGADALWLQLLRGSRRLISSRRIVPDSFPGRASFPCRRRSECHNGRARRRCASRAASKRSSFTALKLLSSARRSDSPVWIRAVCACKASILLAQALQFNTPNLLLDAWSDAAYGGTGRNVDWNSAARFAAAQPSRRVNNSTAG